MTYETKPSTSPAARPSAVRPTPGHAPFGANVPRACSDVTCAAFSSRFRRGRAGKRLTAIPRQFRGFAQSDSVPAGYTVAHRAIFLRSCIFFDRGARVS